MLEYDCPKNTRNREVKFLWNCINDKLMSRHIGQKEDIVLGRGLVEL
jgi:hypothetical protein